VLLCLVPSAPCGLLSSLFQALPGSLGGECADQKVGSLLLEGRDGGHSYLMSPLIAFFEGFNFFFNRKDIMLRILIK